MLDAYSSIAMPLFYKHWSFGKHFARNEALYRAGMQGLAYEIVINSNPCISYIMEENTATMQTLVIAHAAFGHNHFFKNNYCSSSGPTPTASWTTWSSPSDYIMPMRGAIRRGAGRAAAGCRARADEPRRAPLPAPPRRWICAPRKSAQRERREHDEQVFNDLWRTVPGKEQRQATTRPRRSAARAAGTAAGEHPVLPGEDRAAAGALAARGSAHRAHHRAVFLSADRRPR